MSLPVNLDPSSSDVGFSGNIALQCANGTFPECRPLLVRQLAKEVARGNMDQVQADKRLMAAEELWEKSVKDQAVASKVAERDLVRAERENDLCRACSNQIAELRGVPVDSLKAVIVEKNTDDEPVEDPVKRPRGRPRK